jgi:hypothetical protein
MQATTGGRDQDTPPGSRQCCVHRLYQWAARNPRHGVPPSATGIVRSAAECIIHVIHVAAAAPVRRFSRPHAGRQARVMYRCE